MDIIKIDLLAGRKILAMGVGKPLEIFVNNLLQSGFPASSLVVVTDKLREDAVFISALPVTSGLCHYSVDPQDSAALIDVARKTQASVCCVFAWYAILKSEFISLYAGRIFNMHFGDLPRYRGAGGFSWQILNGESKVSAHIHVLIPKVDAGALVLTETKDIKLLAPYPNDFINSAQEAANVLVRRFAKLIASANYLEAIPQDEEKADYFPKLTTAKNGVIDFDWSVLHVERFIRAFSHPYPGASFIYKDTEYRVKECRIVKSGMSFHPFVTGLITNKTENGLLILVHDGCLSFENISSTDQDHVSIKGFRIGDRLSNSVERLSASRSYRP